MKIKSQRNFDKLLSFANFKNFNTIIINLWEQNFIHNINRRTFPTTSSKTSIITHNLEFKVKNVFEFIKVMCYIHHANIQYFFISFSIYKKRIECCDRKNCHSIDFDRLPNYRIPIQIIWICLTEIIIAIVAIATKMKRIANTKFCPS